MSSPQWSARFSSPDRPRRRRTRPARSPLTTVGLAAAAGGGVLWILGEVVEALRGINTPFSEVLLIGGSLLIALGAPFLHRGQLPWSGRTGLAGSALVTLGAALAAANDVLAWGARTNEEVERANGLLVIVYGAVLVSGLIVLGVAVLRARVYPFWTGAVLVLAPLQLPAALAVDLPSFVVAVANSMIGLALATMAATAWTAERPVRRVDL